VNNAHLLIDDFLSKIPRNLIYNINPKSEFCQSDSTHFIYL